MMSVIDYRSRPIATERLLLRPFEAGDLDAMFAIWSRPDVVRFLYDEPRTRDETAEMLRVKIGRRSLRLDGDRLSFAIVLRSTGELVGDDLLALPSVEHRQGEIGFVVHPDHQGHGYATEASRPLLQIAFGQIGLHRVVGRTEARNAASARVLEKLGMRREAHFVENEFVKGEWQSELVYAILDRDWGSRSGDT
jgi:RimJ/RimL family protein N-acetyltransferase